MMGLLHQLTKRLSATGFMAQTESMTLADLAIYVTISTLNAINIIPLSKYHDLTLWLSHCKAKIPNHADANQKGVDRVLQFYLDKVSKKK